MTDLTFAIWEIMPSQLPGQRFNNYIIQTHLKSNGYFSNTISYFSLFFLQLIKKIYIIGTYFRVKGGNSSMAKTVVRENESLDDALRRFKRQVSRTGTLAEARKREFYVKPGLKRKLKSEAARKNNKGKR